MAENKEDAISAIINEIYGIASELLISSDKTAQEHGQQLRKLIEQLEPKISPNIKAVE